MKWFKGSFLYFAVLVWGFTPAVSQQMTITGQILVDDGQTKKHRAADNAGAVVWLEPSQSGARLSWTTDRHFILAQRDHAFVPHLLIVPVGARIQFPNEDLIFHNVFSMFQAKRFDLGLYEAGSSKAILFDKPGVSYIFCNIHPQMGAVVIVLSAPYYGISGSDGRVKIEHVPIGTYRLKVWAEGASDDTLESLARDIVVTGDLNFENIRIRVTPSVNLTHMNKFGHPYDPDPPSYDSQF